jgi:hypothetical protein
MWKNQDYGEIFRLKLLFVKTGGTALSVTLTTMFQRPTDESGGVPVICPFELNVNPRATKPALENV